MASSYGYLAGCLMAISDKFIAKIGVLNVYASVVFKN
jgi:hypothetical protein